MLDAYFKQYFWTFHLVLLGVAAFMVAWTANAFVAGALATPPEAMATTPAPEARKQERPRGNDPSALAAFLDRNIFKAEREDLVAKAGPENEPVDTGVFDENNCERSGLGAGLVATIVAKEPTDSIAVFEDRNKKETVTHRVGEKVLEEAEIVTIEWRRVTVRHGGRCEEFSLEDESKAPTLAATTPPDTATPEPAPGNQLGKDIKQLADNSFEIPKKEIDAVLGDLNSIATQARIVPSFNNGKANGFKLFSIRPNSIYTKIGIQNGDIVQRINGYEMNSPDKALEIYSKLKDAQSITVDLIRRGQTQTLTYNIR